jgi:hypothetical protein
VLQITHLLVRWLLFAPWRSPDCRIRRHRRPFTRVLNVNNELTLEHFDFVITATGQKRWSYDAGHRHAHRGSDGHVDRVPVARKRFWGRNALTSPRC